MGRNRFFHICQAVPGMTGIQTEIDLYAMTNLGLERELTYLCIGEFVGTIAIEGSLDKKAWGVMKSYSVQDLVTPDIGEDTEGYSEISNDDVTVRFFRVNIKGRIISKTTVTVAGQEKCASK